MAPEVITESLHSKAADIYSFGVVLWELLACAKPFSGMHYAQIVHAIAQNKVRARRGVLRARCRCVGRLLVGQTFL
jgi:serine/threonine protein kinase